jgi:hypothetical protein
VDQLAAQAAFNPAAVSGKIQCAYFSQGDYQGDEEGEKGIHAVLLWKKKTTLRDAGKIVNLSYQNNLK